LKDAASCRCGTLVGPSGGGDTTKTPAALRTISGPPSRTRGATVGVGAGAGAGTVADIVMEGNKSTAVGEY
jgi:hypothetical protein